MERKRVHNFQNIEVRDLIVGCTVLYTYIGSIYDYYVYVMYVYYMYMYFVNALGFCGRYKCGGILAACGIYLKIISEHNIWKNKMENTK